jgi:phosphotransferase family enzyme
VRVGGRRRVARDSGAARSGAALDWELDLLQELAGAGFTVPVPVPTRDGRRRVGGLVVLTWLDGEPPGDERAWRLVGDELARLHRHTASRRQRPGFASTRELLTAERGGDVRLDRMPPEVVALCRAARSRLACAPLAVVHGDPGPQNLRLQGDRVGLLDWDESRVDCPELDLAWLPLDRLGRARRRPGPPPRPGRWPTAGRSSPPTPTAAWPSSAAASRQPPDPDPRLWTAPGPVPRRPWKDRGPVPRRLWTALGTRSWGALGSPSGGPGGERRGSRAPGTRAPPGTRAAGTWAPRT